MRKITAETLIVYMIELLTSYLIELSVSEEADDKSFIYGEKLAYVECLELLQHWEYANVYGLDYDVEKRFPL